MAKKVDLKTPKPRAHEPTQCVQAQLRQFGKLVKGKRLQAAIRQQELAERLGVSTVTVQKIEAGTPGVAWGIVASTADTLGLPFGPACLPDGEIQELLDIAAERERVR